MTTRVLLRHGDPRTQAVYAEALAELGQESVDVESATHRDLAEAPAYFFDPDSPRALAYARGLADGRPEVALVCLGRRKAVEELVPVAYLFTPTPFCLKIALGLALPA